MVGVLKEGCPHWLSSKAGQGGVTDAPLFSNARQLNLASRLGYVEPFRLAIVLFLTCS